MDDDTVLVCERITTPLLLPDNHIGKCFVCETKVQFRPHAPKMRRMCLRCAVDRIDEVTDILVTPETIQEVAEWRKKRRH
jgi:hypothetical protein